MATGLSRRQVLASFGAAAMATTTEVAAGGIPAHTPVVTGRVMTHEGGLGGVMVSNGRDVVLSANDGSWSLPALDDCDIFLIKPPHYRIEGRQGTAGDFHVACATDAPLPRDVVFLLVPEPEPQRFDVVLLTDTQPDSHAELDYVRDDIVSGILATPAAFGIHHGDVVSDALHLYARHKDILGVTRFPWHHCVGNHDVDRDAASEMGKRATWRQTFGPRWYAFRHAQAVFFILDNVDFIGCPDGRYRGRLGAEQLGFVARVLEHVPKDHLVVLSMHIPLSCYLDPANPADTTADAAELLRLLQGRPHSVSFSGHLHATEHHYLPMPDQAPSPHHHHVLTAGSGSWWSGPKDPRGIPSADSTDGSPNGFHILRIDGTRYVTDFVPALGKRPAPLRAMLQARPDGTHHARLLANVFDGGPRTRVALCLEAGDWCEMQQQTLCDPLVCRMLSDGSPRKSWVEATPSSHIWTLDLKEGLPERAMRVRFRVIDEYGRQYENDLIVEPQLS